MYKLLFISFFLRFVASCTVSDTTFDGHSAKIVSVEPANTAIKHTVGGTVTIIDGCTFKVRNATLIPSGNAAYWYAIPVKNNSDYLPRVVAIALGSYNGQTITFALDPQYSFSEIAVMMMWSEGDNRAYGAFNVNGTVDTYFSNKQKGADFDLSPTSPFLDSSANSAKLSLNFSFIFIVLFMFI